MNVSDMLKTIGEQISAFASGKLAFAEPVLVGDRTVIPVAWVRYDFGAGGSTPAAYRRLADEAGGGGGGGQVSVIPAGIIEITQTATRFIPIPDGKKIFALVASSFGGSSVNHGGAPDSGNKSFAAKAPTKKQVAAHRAAKRKAVGKSPMPAAQKAPAKRTPAKKAAALKASRPLSRKAAPVNTSAKKSTSTARKSAAKRG